MKCVLTMSFGLRCAYTSIMKFMELMNLMDFIS